MATVRKSCHDALRQLNQEVMSQPVNWIVDLDLAQFFDTMPHLEILTLLQQQIKDRKFLQLVARMLKAGFRLLEVVQGELGSPQGSIVSPVLANIFLDQVLDQWFMTVVRQHCRGYCALIRYADDSIAVFEFEDDARRFICRNDWRNSDCASTKPKPNCCRLASQAAGIQGWERLPTFDFLSFTQGKKSDGKSSIEAKDHKERFRRALASINQWLRQERNARKLPEIWQAIGQSCVDISTTLGSPTTVVRYTALNGRYTAPEMVKST